MKTFYDFFNAAVAAGLSGEDAAKKAQADWEQQGADAVAAEAAAAQAESDAKAASYAADLAAQAAAAEVARMQAESDAKAAAEDAEHQAAEQAARLADLNAFVRSIPVAVITAAGCTNGMSDETIARRCAPLMPSAGG
jgi:membrane protein involved in colicin uptake